MNELLGPLYQKIVSKLGPVAPFIPTLADAIKINIADGDAAGIQARAREAREAAAELTILADKCDAAVADGQLSGREAAELLVEVENVIDEFEDVITGIDEDD